MTIYASSRLLTECLVGQTRLFFACQSLDGDDYRIRVEPFASTLVPSFAAKSNGMNKIMESKALSTGAPLSRRHGLSGICDNIGTLSVSVAPKMRGPQSGTGQDPGQALTSRCNFAKSARASGPSDDESDECLLDPHGTPAVWLHESNAPGAKP